MYDDKVIFGMYASTFWACVQIGLCTLAMLLVGGGLLWMRLGHHG